MCVCECVASIFRIINEHFALFLSCLVVVEAVVGIIRYHAQCPSHRHIIYPLNHIGTKCCVYDEFNSNRLRCSMDEVTNSMSRRAGRKAGRRLNYKKYIFSMTTIQIEYDCLHSALHCMQIE